MTGTWVALAVLGYIVGSIPVGFLLGKARGLDIREHGSKNIGATNVRRVLGSKLGNLCFVLDLLKGLVPTLGAGLFTRAIDADPSGAQTWWWMLVAAMPMVGHVFPVWLKFKGGKGVATGLGTMLGVFPSLTIAAAAAGVVWVVSVKITRMVGVSSCFAALALPIAAGAQWSFGRVGVPHLVVTGLLALLVIVRHRGNIARTLAGTEPKIGEGKKTGEGAG